MRVLVTGASGFIGSEVTRQLVASGLRPRVMVRRPTRAAILDGLDVEAVHGDLTVPDTLPAAVAGCDAIIHLGGRAVFEPARRLEPTFIHGTRALADAAEAAGVRRFVFGSSLLVHGPSHDAVTATTGPAPVLDYGRVKLRMEDELAQRSGLSVASIRLPHVYGAGDQLFANVRRGVMAVPGRSSSPFSHLHVHDAARVLIAAAQGTWTGARGIGDRDPAGWDRFLGELQRLLPRLVIVRLPAALALAGTSLMRVARSRLQTPDLLTPDTVRAWNQALWVDPDLLWGELGLEPEVPDFRVGLKRSLDDAVDHVWRHSVSDRRRV
ncbi:MAG: NAD(P)H-binding protein [Actinomycetota bacterium]|nr:NAD(P)H-binding protein [Actinomycetota bacterium]